jgi:hypothetical protein
VDEGFRSETAWGAKDKKTDAQQHRRYQGTAGRAPPAGRIDASVVRQKFVAEQPQVLRLRLAQNHPSDEDLSPGTPVTRQSPLSDCLFCQEFFAAIECGLWKRRHGGASENDEAVFRFPTTPTTASRLLNRHQIHR